MNRAPAGREPTPEQRAGTRLGIPDPVSPGWQEYGRSAIADHAREVHYDVLRKSGFSSMRAKEIAAESADGQQRHLDEWGGLGQLHARETLRRSEPPPEESSRPADSLFGSFLRTLGGS